MKADDTEKLLCNREFVSWPEQQFPGVQVYTAFLATEGYLTAWLQEGTQ